MKNEITASALTTAVCALAVLSFNQQKQINGIKDETILLLKKELVDIRSLVSEAKRGRRLVTEDSPFTCDGSWCTADPDKYYLFPKGIVIGQKNEACLSYGDAILSVDNEGSNCPSGKGSVTFGTDNKASGLNSIILGGTNNIASGYLSHIVGARDSEASGRRAGLYSGWMNKALGTMSVVIGGQANEASGSQGSIIVGAVSSEATAQNDPPIWRMG